MKRHLIGTTVAVLIATVAVAAFGGGGREQAQDPGSAQDSGSAQNGAVNPAPDTASDAASDAAPDTASDAREQMRRLVTIGAELRTDGGSFTPVDLPPELQHQRPPGDVSRFKTDFSRALIPYSEIVAGGPSKDGIPAIDDPRFVSITEAGRWMRDDEAVLAVTVGGTTHLYPLQILMWHEIVNDRVNGNPLAVTYCPLCNTGVVFDRRFDRELLDFGVTGRLVYSNMIMYDRQTESWWIQATGRGVAGRYAGQQLALVPSTLLPWRQAKGSFAKARVLSFDTGHRRDYGRNPYVGYDSSTDPFLYRGPKVTDANSEDAMMRVLSVYHGDAVTTVAFPQLEAERVVRRQLDGTDVVVFRAPGTASALEDSWVSGGRDVGTANAYYPVVDGRPLTFSVENDRITDRQTGSVWNEAGLAVEGELAGHRLEPALSVHHFLFSWRAFHPSATSPE